MSIFDYVFVIAFIILFIVVFYYFVTGLIIKEGIVNLRGEELDENKLKFLNLGPKFLPTENRKDHTWTLVKLQKFVH